ncbi:hypothetical protein Q5P01_005042 [Channa striata]|uniref:Uncharacterized protein n=1 Tax=Channa striata TaxID=64152 RepID=A0AA88NCZ2_CHASR|nr:hypothetical protein Q5P01_005042 [Channa striata]
MDMKQTKGQWRLTKDSGVKRCFNYPLPIQPSPYGPDAEERICGKLVHDAVRRFEDLRCLGRTFLSAPPQRFSLFCSTAATVVGRLG